MFIVIPQYLLYFVQSMLFAMQKIGCDLQIWFDYRFTFIKCFNRFISTSAI